MEMISAFMGVSSERGRPGRIGPPPWETAHATWKRVRPGRPRSQDRREFLVASAALFAGVGRADDLKKSPLGIVIHSYPVRSRDKGFTDPLHFLSFCHDRGAAGIQTSLGSLSADQARGLRSTAEKFGMYVEGSIRSPKDRSDVERFEKEIVTSKACGATVVRTVMLGSRRYETFHAAKEFAAFADQARITLRLAERVVAKHGITLAIENHKDFRTDELIDLLKAISSEHLGVCVDTGNSIALLERPTDTIAALAPFARSCHLKDMGVEESPDGFLLAEVPLGRGFLDLSNVVGTLTKAWPRLRFSLEMITRDPLRIPCLTDDYWSTLAQVPSRDLARTLAMVKKHAAKEPLPRTSKLSPDDQRAAEDANVRRCLEHARERLEL
jgi:3-oxoisoapionate decarboxylase